MPPGAGARVGSYGFQFASGSAVASISAPPLVAVAGVPAAAGALPVIWMAITIPDSLCPATVHHASVAESNGPIVIVSLVPGSNILVPSVPSTLRSCAIIPSFVTVSTSF